MYRFCLAVVAAAACAFAGASQAAEWRVQRLDTPARVTAIETIGGQTLVMAGGLWYRIELTGPKARLVFVEAPPQPERPEGALPDGRVAYGTRNIVRTWLSEPTRRYGHGVLGDAIEAGALEIETRGGHRQTIRLKDDAVFEDLQPRLADLDGDGIDEIVVVKAYLARGASLAVIADRNGKYEIVAETPPLGQPNRWLDPAGIADFNGDGKLEIALVRQPHVVGALELWGWAGTTMRKIAELPGVSNHAIGSRAIDMSAVADFDGDGIADLAVPSLDRRRLRFISFVSGAREIAVVALPAQAVTNLALVSNIAKPAVIAAGLADGSLVLIRRD
ncbi:MAG: VCBS repeat-containing protein [Pseudolabrys sp.]|nr:VCBS repeat-containing protein [Pseudolabrys sp.]